MSDAQTLQIVYGSLCDRNGRPIAVEVFQGNTVHHQTLRSQIEAICKTAIASYEAAVASGDSSKVAGRFVTDGTLNTPDGIFRGRQAIAA